MIVPTSRERRAFGVGALAAALALATMALLRFVLGVPSLPEVLADLLLGILPGTAFAIILDAFGSAAKPLLYASLGIGQLVVGGVLAISYARRRAGWWTALTLAAGVWALLAVLVFPLAGFGPLASGLRGGPLLTLIVLPLSLLVYAGYLVWGSRAYVPSGEPWLDALTRGHSTTSRRQFLARVGVGGAAIAGAFAAWRGQTDGRPVLQTARAGVGGASQGGPGTALAGLAANARTPPALVGADRMTPRVEASGDLSAASSSTASVSGLPNVAAPLPGAPSLLLEFQVAGLSPEVTANDEHYVVSKNFIDPSVDPGAWRLKIDGMVSHPLELSYEQLRALPQASEYYTLECISNVVGGDLMGTARWIGVKLADLIRLAGPLPGVVDAQLSAYDDYVESVSIQRALKPDNLLAFEMNEEILTESHGFPARLMIPGIYGMKNVKWLTRVTLVSDDVKGYWQHRGWSDLAEYKTMSRIDTPSRGATVAVGAQRVAGVAFAGERGIKRIEVSFDDGATWTDAAFKQPLSSFTWVLWVVPWKASTGATVIAVRATDGSGAVQTSELHGTVPDGAAGYHSISTYAE